MNASDTSDATGASGTRQQRFTHIIESFYCVYTDTYFSFVIDVATQAVIYVSAGCQEDKAACDAAAAWAKEHNIDAAD